eukprot:jgi/Botrbrau1/2732/Bobra.0164s0012.1
MDQELETHHLFIPVAGSNEVVAVPIDELPEEAEDLLDILRAEEAPLALWLDFAKAYLAQGLTKQYLYILQEGTQPEVEHYFGKSAEFERIQIFCALASYHTRKGRIEKDRAKKTEEFQLATTFLNTARGINVGEQLPHIGLGQLALAKGDLEVAAASFTRAQGLLSRGRPNIMGVLSLANVLVKQKKYSDALNLYSRALKEHPGAPAEVRLGLGICFFQLGKFDKARAAFERVLQLDPTNCDALLGLSVLSLNAAAPSKVPGDLKIGLQYLCNAYQSDPSNPGVLSLLAQICLVRGEFDKSMQLATAAVEGTDLEKVQADSFTVVARANHAMGNYNDAYRSYQQASKLDAQAPLPLYGLAQLSLLQHSGEHTNAISLLENALTHVPGWIDALKVLGQLYPQTERKGNAAIEHFREAAQKPGSSSEVWEMLADLLAATDPSGSLNAYKKALALAREAQDKERAQLMKAARRKAKESKGLENGHILSQDSANEQAEGSKLSDEEASNIEAEVEASLAPLPPRLLNNAGVLHLRIGDTAAGASLFQEALESAESPGTTGVTPANLVTLGYNRARAREASGALRAAEDEYKSILQAFPAYMDCYIRLACIASRRGATEESLEWANKALALQPDNPDILGLLGWLHLNSSSWSKAEQCFQKVTVNQANKNDAYAWLGLATLNLYSTPRERRKEPEAGKADRALTRAGEAYKRVLDKTEGTGMNVYAANGIGAVLAERGHLTTAREIFTSVQEAAAASEGLLRIPDVAVNLGNVHLAQQEYVTAIQMYQSTLKKYYGGRDATVLLYLARAYYDSDRLPEACSALLKALHLQPTNHELRFNVALTLQEHAVRLLRKKRPEGDPTKLEEFERSAMELGQAHRFFTQLVALGEAATGIPTRRLDTHIAFCADTHGRAAQHLDLAIKEADALEAKRQQSQKALEAAQRQKELELEHKRAAEAKTRENAERLAREAALRLENMRSQWRESTALQQAAEEGDAARVDKRRKKKKMEAALAGVDEEDEYEPQDEDEAAEYLNNSDARARLAGTGLLSDDEDEGEVEAEAVAGPDASEAATPAGKSRLKRRRADDAVEGGENELADLGDDLGDSGGEGDADMSTGKRQKRAAARLLEDSDEEEVVDIGSASKDVEMGAEVLTGQKPADDDLFGSDSD